MTTAPIRLNPTEIVPEHPFTDPAGSEEDMALLAYMRQRLRNLLEKPDKIPPQSRPYVTYLQTMEDRYLRVALAQPETLRCYRGDLTMVGFCGRKWPHADRAPLDAVDEALIAEFPQHRHLLGYTSLELSDGNWCNMVLFQRPEGILHWTNSVRHAYAVNELTPTYYRLIRLHNALLPGGLMSDREPILLRTKYYDFEDETVWRAVRELRRSNDVDCS